MEKVKYPKTPYLPWSPGMPGRHERIFDVNHFAIENKNVTVTLKMDGENTTMGRDYIHARSLDWVMQPWRTRVHTIWRERVSYRIPDNMRIVGENMQAIHSIAYDDLEDWFLVHSIWEDNLCLNYPVTSKIAAELGLKMVPYVIGTSWTEAKLVTIPEGHEGYVVRLTGPFEYELFHKSIAKAVRKDHVQTDQHWSKKPMVENKLRSSESS